MPARIVYVHHSAFILDLGGRTFLFDYPEDRHLPPGAAEVVRRNIAGTDLYVFISHGHEDHFNRQLTRIVSPAARARFVVSDDVPDMFPEAVPEDALVVEPDQRYRIDGMTVETLMANDLGVAFIIDFAGVVVYFAGDLAEWVWPGMEPAAIRFTENYFQETLDTLKRRRVGIAFQNLDQRLGNQGGGMKFLHQIQPAVFVPMHGFGDTTWYAGLDYGCRPATTRIFEYRAPGDEMVFDPA